MWESIFDWNELAATGSDDTATDASPPAHTPATPASGDGQGTAEKSNAKKYSN